MMVGRKIGRTCAVCGVLMLVLGMRALPAQGAEPAPQLTQPSPRPTLAPTASPPTPAPPTPAPPTPVPRDDSDSDDEGGSTGAGRITGTIIDLNTGAPVSGVTVDVGGQLITSDANGNYDHWLPAGSYNVSLALPPEQGIPAQGPQSVELAQDSTVVMHLGFRGPLAPTATTEPPPSEPSAAAPAPTTASRPAGASAQRAPNRLPLTSEPANTAWLWLTLGAILLAAGGALELTGGLRRAPLMAGARGAHSTSPRSRSSGNTAAPSPDNTALLAALLAGDARPGRRSRRRPADDHSDQDTALLKSLLTEEVRQGSSRRRP